VAQTPAAAPKIIVLNTESFVQFGEQGVLRERARSAQGWASFRGKLTLTLIVTGGIMASKAPKTSAAKSAKTALKTAVKAVAKPAPKSAVKPAAKSAAKPAVKSAPKAEAGLKVGAKAPAFKLADETGKIVTLSDFAGRTLVLYFYPKDSTPGCTQESCDFRDNLNRLTSSGAAVAGLSADSVASHKKFKEKYSLNFPLLSDPEHKALEAYGVWQEKSLYGRKFMGIVRSTFIIDGQGVIKAVFPKVSVTGHVDEVLATLKNLKTGAAA
jgi:thioredoxin-dependent peroxiredoxin